MVTDEEFSQFLNDEVTPRFPDGLTLLKGYGQSITPRTLFNVRTPGC